MKLSNLGKTQPTPKPATDMCAVRYRRNCNPVDSNVVMMDPVIVRADRGLSSQQFRMMDSSIQQQARTAADQKFAIVKVHEVKLSRKLYFGYVTLFGVPVAASFSW
jgi:hypothetical protein